MPAKRKSQNGQKIQSNSDHLSTAPFRFNCLFSNSAYKNKPIYALKFNPFATDRDIFAACIVDEINVFECVNPSNDDDPDEVFCGIKQIKRYKGDAYYYALDWSYDKNANHVIAFGDKNGIIRTVSMATDVEGTLVGHTGAINDLKFNKEHPFMLISASEDNSLRMWNVENSKCVAVFAGEIHRDQVLTVDINHTGDFMVSGGMDHNLVIWRLDTEEIKRALLASQSSTSTSCFNTIRVYENEFSTRDIHNSYIDSVIWFSPNSFISKSYNGEVFWSKAGALNEATLNLSARRISKLFAFKSEDCVKDRIWFLRMELDRQGKHLALGTFSGKILVWNLELESDMAETAQNSIVSTSKCTRPVRMVSFSNNGSILVACSEDGKILRYDKVQ